MRFLIGAQMAHFTPNLGDHVCPVCHCCFNVDKLSEEREHAQVHRKWQRIAAPKPLPSRYLKPVETSGPVYVGPESTKRVWREVGRRAKAFKQETKFNAYWPAEKNKEFEYRGVIFVNAPNVIIGAASFMNGQSPRLMWIWIAPSFQRQGVLSRAWPTLAKWFKNFEIEKPLSQSMEMFLSKM